MIWSNRWAGRSILYVVTLTGILTPLPLVALSQYNHPHADDYCAAVWADIWGLLGAQGYVYLNWSGRYFATLLRTTSPITFRWIAGYKVVTLFLLLLFPVSLYWLIDRALRTKPLETAALTSGVFTTFVFGMPSIASGFYWFSGAVTYVFSAILFMFLLGFLIQLYEGEGRTRPKVLACCFLLLAVVGSNETLMFIWGLFVGVTTMIQLVYRGVLDRFWVVLLFLSLTSCLIVLNAPGNDIRLATFAQGSIYPTDVKLIGSIGAAARSSMIRAFDQAWHWLFASPLWLFSLLVLPMAAVYSGDKVKSARSLYQVSLPLVVIVEAMLFTAAYFPSYLGDELCRIAHGERDFSLLFVGLALFPLAGRTEVSEVDTPHQGAGLGRPAAVSRGHDFSPGRAQQYWNRIP